MSKANVVDSSAWLEYVGGTERSSLFAEAIEDVDNLYVPVICLYEVYKKMLRERGDDAAFTVTTIMRNGHIVDIDSALAVSAARYALPLADSLIYATARKCNAILWTQDGDFDGLSDIRYIPK